MFRTYEQHAAATINDIISDMGFRRREFEMRSIPFSGSWGTSSSIAFAIANEATADDPDIEDESLSKKERKALQQNRVREKATELAEQIAAALQQRPEYARVEAVNGYINIYFDTTSGSKSRDRNRHRARVPRMDVVQRRPTRS